MRRNRQALAALMSNVEQPQTSTARRRRPPISNGDQWHEVQEQLLHAFDALAVSCSLWPFTVHRCSPFQHVFVSHGLLDIESGVCLQGAVGENVVAEAAALACSQAAGCASAQDSERQDCRVAVRWQQECARKIQAAEAVRSPAPRQSVSGNSGTLCAYSIQRNAGSLLRILSGVTGC